MNRFGRIVLTFDQPTKVKVRSANGVVVIGFDTPARIRQERLAGEMAPYVSAVRRDPDDTGLRLALVGPVRPNVLEAGERVFIDLLPPNWTGLPPSLPPEVVAELAERARSAEIRLRRGEGSRREGPRPVSLRIAELPTLTRLVFEPPSGTPIRLKQVGPDVELGFEGVPGLETSGARPKLAPGVSDFAASTADGSLLVKVAAASGYGAHTFREGDTVVVDLAKPTAPTPLPAPLPEPARTVAAPPPAAAPIPVAAPQPPTISSSPADPAQPVQPVAKAAPPPSPTAPPPSPAMAPGPVKAAFESASDGASLLFPFRTRTAAAAFERDGRLTLVFDTPDRLDLTAAKTASAGVLTLEDPRPEEGVAVVRLIAPEGWPARLLLEGDAWRLVLGARSAPPPDALAVGRAIAANGDAQVAVGLRAASSVRWLGDPDGGARTAVVTASGRPQAIVSRRSLVEFSLPATLQGLVVEADADDLTVAPGHAGILIGRRGGLTLSASGPAQDGGVAAAEPVLAGDASFRDGPGGFLQRYRELIAAAANAPRPGRAEARYRLARFLVAHGLDHEAASVLALARGDDPLVGKRREMLLLSGIAAARSGRWREAGAALGSEPLRDDPEAVLWRAVLDARERRWRPALAGFARATGVLGLYPEEISGPLRLAAAGAALEAGEIGRAEVELTTVDRMASGAVPRDAQDLARARLDEASGRTEAALKAYDRLAEEGARPIAAEATLRSVALSVRTGRLDPAEAIRRLEGLSVTWRGGDIELATLVELSKLYAGAGRWRDVFSASRRANHQFPDHELTRGLHDSTAKMFDRVFLGATKLPAVETLALYYDFKEFAPIGRRGDEIVRRLADRLVELDLLGQAADLLQHQVDKRLTGAARATVAARLAAIRLMNGEPGLALSALQATRLAELPGDVGRFRLLLEARAQADLSRTDLALEIVDGEDRPEFGRLRAGILFGARRWREAGEAGEGLLGRRWQAQTPLSPRERGDVIRVAIAFVLADERLGLDRLRQKFGTKMADSPDAKSLDLLMRPGVAQTREFRALAQEASRADALRQLLGDWTGLQADGSGSQSPGTEPARAG